MNERSPLIDAVCSASIDTVELLINNGADVDAKDNYGCTALMYAIENGNHVIAKMLVNKSIYIDIQNNYKETPLIIATIEGQKELVVYLLDRGANIEICDKYRHTPLMWAITNGYYDIVEILINKGANINYQQNRFKNAPLLRAITMDEYAIAELLINKGANLYVKNLHHITPLMYAIKHDNSPIVDLIICKVMENVPKEVDYGVPCQSIEHFYKANNIEALLNDANLYEDIRQSLNIIRNHVYRRKVYIELFKIECLKGDPLNVVLSYLSK